MTEAYIFRYGACALALALSALGTGIGQGIAGVGMVEGSARQPAAADSMFRTLIVGLALGETGSILVLVFVVLLFFSPHPASIGAGIAELGIGLSLGTVAGCVSFASCMAVKSACISSARQPFFAQKIVMFMVLLQSIAQAPLIFSFIISLLIRAQLSSISSPYHGLILLCVSIIVAVGCIGPSIGQSYFLARSLEAVGINKHAYGALFAFSLLSVAVIETPVIFSLIISFILLYRPFFEAGGFMAFISAIATVFSMAFGALGTGIGLGYITGSAVSQIAQAPSQYPNIFRSALVSIGFVESSVIYSLVVSLMLLLV